MNLSDRYRYNHIFLFILTKVEFFEFEGGASEWLSFFGCPPGLVFFWRSMLKNLS